MLKKWTYTALMIGLFTLASCQEDEVIPLPTQFDLEAAQTQDAATTIYLETLNAPTVTPTSNIPTLPPQNTAMPTPLLPTETASPSPSPEGYSETGTIYYIYNGDSIIATTGDGSREEFIYTVGMNVPIEYLTPSPDGKFLAFIAPGNGSAREVWIMNRDASYTQQVSCLGFADVRLPAWSADGEWLAFAASQNPGGALDIYTASRIAPFCSDDTHKLLLKLGSLSLGGLAYALSGEQLFYSNPVTHALDLTTGEVSPALTRDIGFGPDYHLAFNPQRPRLLAYLQTQRSPGTSSSSGFFYTIDIAATREVIPPTIEMRSPTSTFQWSQDGQFIVMSSQNSVYVWDTETNTADGIVIGTYFPPQAVFSPDSSRVAYLDVDPNNPQLAQIYTVNDRGRDQRQVTANTEGTINTIIWLENGW